MRVGLLEDDNAIQEMLVLLLQEEGYTVFVYADAEECLAALGVTVPEPVKVSVDLMIIDWRLGGSLSGTEVIQLIRNNSRFVNLPIILTTAAMLENFDELQVLRVVLLEKPFAVEDMLFLIKKLLVPLSNS